MDEYLPLQYMVAGGLGVTAVIGAVAFIILKRRAAL
jgi:hypothetical protein